MCIVCWQKREWEQRTDSTAAPPCECDVLDSDNVPLFHPVKLTGILPQREAHTHDLSLYHVASDRGLRHDKWHHRLDTFLYILDWMINTQRQPFRIFLFNFISVCDIRGIETIANMYMYLEWAHAARKSHKMIKSGKSHWLTFKS